MILSRSLKIAAASLFLLLGCVALTGCGSSGSRASVEGTVNLDSQPVDGGTISFVPEEYTTKEGERTIETAEIKDGKYSLSGKHGLVPGKYRVDINWKKKTGRQIPNNDPPPPMVDEMQNVIPEEYNKNSKDVKDIQATGNKFDFDLKSKPKTGPGRRNNPGNS